MKIETTPWGSRLADKPYFPLYLANGVDAMMINILGSGDAWFEQCDYGAPLSVQRSPGWYKCDRRTHDKIELVYGSQFPLFEFASSPILNGDRVVPRSCRQWFDPRKATLTTFYEQNDNETEEWLRVRVTTFLTKEHVLVEHYEILEAPASGTAIVFFLNSPSEAYLRLYERTVRMDRASLKVDAKRALMCYDFEFDGFRGGARSWFDCEAAEGTAMERKKDVFVHGHLQTRRLHGGESFTRYLAALDNVDCANYRKGLNAAWDGCRELGYERLKERHQGEWGSYFAASRVEIPDPVATYLYDVSRYVFRANLHPSGFLPIGLLPYLWQGTMFWDAGFVVEAMLGCGHLAEAQRVVDHMRSYRPEARKLARGRGGRGARLEWTVEVRKFTRFPWPVTQVHNNAWWAHLIHACHRATGDRAFLARNFDFMGELLLFLTDGFLEDRGDHFVVRRCQGVDESMANEKTNDTWTCAVTLRALEDYRDAARTLDRRPVVADLDRVIAKLRVGLERNVDSRGVMQSFQGGRLPHWGSLIFDLFPEHPSLKPTLAKMMENHDPEMKLYNLHGVTRYAEKAFPWCNFWAARIFSRVGDARAQQLLTNAMESVNYFGGMPERVFYHGELFNHWTVTVHAAMVWAVNGMLANAIGDRLRILGGAQGAWSDAKFEGIHAGEGLVVSAEIRQGRLSRLEIVNLFTQRRDVECVLGNEEHGRIFALRPGKNRCLSATPPAAMANGHVASGRSPSSLRQHETTAQSP